MPLPQPNESDLVVKMDKRGRMQVFYRGEPLPGVTKVECVQDIYPIQAEVRITFFGRAVKLETEKN